jgi:anaerobic ribonucleoside-triphosphate reductase
MLMDPQRETHTRQPRLIGEGVGFERTRRITGYLVGTLDRFNNAKRAEERDRVRHGLESSPSPGDA